jgi:hypothetical protein
VSARVGGGVLEMLAAAGRSGTPNHPRRSQGGLTLRPPHWAGHRNRLVVSRLDLGRARRRDLLPAVHCQPRQALSLPAASVCGFTAIAGVYRKPVVVGRVGLRGTLLGYWCAWVAAMRLASATYAVPSSPSLGPADHKRLAIQY